MTARKARFPLFEPQWSTCRCMAITEPRGGEGSAVCARGGDTSSRRWLRCWQGGHRERRPKRPEESHQHSGGTCRVLRTLLGRWQAHRGKRPAALLEPLPREKLQRHSGIDFEIVQNLDVLVLRLVEQLPNVTQFFATHLPVVAEPVIEVPKILPHDVLTRRLCRDNWRNSW